MILRRQLPVYSPLPFTALVRGMRAAAAPAEAEAWLRAAVGERFGARDVLLTDSGTSALALALRAADRLRSCPVALPAWGCYDLATAADAADVPVLLYDLDPLTLGPNFASLQRALEQGARTVVVAHYYGVPVDMDRVRTLAAEYRALVVEDAAQGAGARIGGRPAGALGPLGVLSFGRGKGITGGGGGALLAHDDSGALAVETVRREVEPADSGLRAVVGTVAQWLLARPAVYALPAGLPFLGLGETVYHPPHPARAPAGFSLGVLGITWTLAEMEAERRREVAARLLAVLAAADGLAPIRTPARDAEPGYLRLPLLAGSAARRRELLARGRALGIMPGYPQPLAALPGFAARVRNAGAEFPGAVALAERLLTLPTHSRLHPRDLARLERLIGPAG